MVNPNLFLRGLNWGPPQLKNYSSWKLRTSSMQWCFKGLTKGLAARIFSLVQCPFCTKPTLEFLLLPFCTKPTLVWWEGTGWTWPWVLLSSSEWLRRRDWRVIFTLKIVGRTEDKRRNCTRIPNKFITFADGSCCKVVKYYRFQ